MSTSTKQHVVILDGSYLYFSMFTYFDGLIEYDKLRKKLEVSFPDCIVYIALHRNVSQSVRTWLKYNGYHLQEPDFDLLPCNTELHFLSGNGSYLHLMEALALRFTVHCHSFFENTAGTIRQSPAIQWHDCTKLLSNCIKERLK